MEEKKPDLTNFKNIFNYVVYGLAGIVSLLYFRANSKDSEVVTAINASLETCEEQNAEHRKTINDLLYTAYNLKKTNDTLKKSAQVSDSVSAQSLKQKAEPYINKIKKLTR